MKAFRALFVCVVCIVAFCCVNEAKAQFGPHGYYTYNETPFGGFTGYVGVSRNNRGLGVMKSYEVGNTTFEGYDVQIQFTNFYFSAPLKAGMRQRYPYIRHRQHNKIYGSSSTTRARDSANSRCWILKGGTHG